LAAVQAQRSAGKNLKATFGELDAMKFRSSVEISGLPPCSVLQTN
jgi:hypothetical protein